MAKNNNLQDYLKDLYEGIVSRKADASKNPQDFRYEIENLAFTGDADATAADIRLGKTAYVNDVKLTGTIADYDGSLINPYDNTTYIAPDGSKPFIFCDELTTTWEDRQTRVIDENYPYSISYIASHLNGDTGMKPTDTGGYYYVGENHLFRVYFETPYDTTRATVTLVASGNSHIMEYLCGYYLYSIDIPLDIDTDYDDMERIPIIRAIDYDPLPLEDRTVVANLACAGSGVHFIDVLVNCEHVGYSGQMDIKIELVEE